VIIEFLPPFLIIEVPLHIGCSFVYSGAPLVEGHRVFEHQKHVLVELLRNLIDVVNALGFYHWKGHWRLD